MGQDFIKIRKARVHNLKNISLDIPKNKLVVITGISGSGKSSLAFDTLYAEGQRRYVESLSAYARQFLGVMQKPDVDKIEGISPAIAIDQRKAAHNPRSTVGTITEIYDYLRLLFARTGKPHCPQCGKEISRQTIDQITGQILKLPPKSEIVILGPVIRDRKGEHRGVLEEIQRAGFIRVRIDGIIYRIDEILSHLPPLPALRGSAIEETLGKSLARHKKHNIEVVVDKLIIEKKIDKTRLVDSLETALKLGKGTVIIENLKLKIKNLKTKSENLVFSEHFACENCEISLPELEPRLFSFNSPYGACSSCQGLGERLEVDEEMVLPNKNLSLFEGAIFPWAHASHKIGRQSYFWQQLNKLAKKYKFSLDVPIKDLSPKIINLILYGEKANSKFKNLKIENSPYEGVIPSLERRYHETDSEYTRKEIEKYMVKKQCEICQGKRLKPEVLSVTVVGKSINEITNFSIQKTKDFFEKILKNKKKRKKIKEKKKETLTENELKIANPIIKEIVNRLQFLIDVGLHYLTLDRKAETLSGGEEQRIRLATQIGSKLTGILYILDEPSVGLHPRDQKRLIKTLKKLKNLGNTVLVVEHDPQTIRAADRIIDIGPGAGKKGGKIVFEGTPKQLFRSKTLTGHYLSGKKKVDIAQSGLKEKAQTSKPQPKSQKFLIVKGARENNLKNINVKIPLGKFISITGVSGSGKSSLIDNILAKALMREFYNSKEEPGEHEDILGTNFLNRVALVDQSPIGRTPRSNPATYTGIFSYIRKFFSQTKEAKIRGYKSGRFSFNVKGGRCEACQGQGQIKIEMYFLPDIYVECQECNGNRFNKETLTVEYKGKNISQVLRMTVEEALEFFKNIPGLSQKLKTLNDVGLNYIELGQLAPSLSGGEAQRVKLAAELSKKGRGSTLYILDEPTTGLHPDDIKKLLFVLKSLVAKGNTVLCVEHNLDMIKSSDWIIDLGPEGGDWGGYIVAEGAPFQIAKNRKSYTGKYLKETLKS